MRVSDFIFKFLSDRGVDTVFMVSGGQAMFLVDAVYRNKDISAVCTHHEQSAGMSAEAYGRITGKLGVALVTAGPGGMNVLNGVAGGWTDSSPMMIVSGQSALSYVQYQQENKIRQCGIQGINIKPMVESITKYFVTVDDPSKISYYMEKAYFLATSGRPGPVWIDVPIDVQKMEVPLKLLQEFQPPVEDTNIKELKTNVSEVLRFLSSAKRPLFIAGQGVRSGKAFDEFTRTVDRFRIPVITSRLGIDLLHSDSEFYVGRPGIYGERSANFAIQNADLIIALGSRLASAMVGYAPKDFGKNARKIVVDVDPKELDKPGVLIDIKVRSDIKVFLKELLKQADGVALPDFGGWAARCNDWKKRYPVVLPSYKDEKPVNSYYFTDKLSQAAGKDDMILVDTGSCFHVACQAWRIKKGQRFLTTGGLSSMGYWAAGLGACVANDKRRTLVITGDGSFQMNIQEIATIKNYKLPIKVFIFNNNGYLLIRATQRNYMEGRFLGEGPETGVWCPDSLKIAEAYGVKGVRINSVDGIEDKIKEVMEHDGPVICDVMTPEWQLIIPRISSEKKPDGTLVSKPYEDMFPFLERKEFLSEMTEKPVDCEGLTLTKIKELKCKKFGCTRIKFRYTDFNPEVILLTSECSESKEMMELLGRWRKENESWYLSQFPVTTERTTRWFIDKVTEVPDRMLFVIKVCGKYIGHTGLFRFDFDKQTCEIDNILRGEKGYPGIMGCAIEAMMSWGKVNLNLKGYSLKVLSDNIRAIRLYKRLGYKEISRIPLIQVDGEDGLEWTEAGTDYKGAISRYYLVMGLT